MENTVLNIRPETAPGVYLGSIQARALKRVTGFTLLRLVLKGTQKRKTGYFKVSFKNGVIHQAGYLSTAVLNLVHTCVHILNFSTELYRHMAMYTDAAGK
jgi:hypothetical protein